MSVPPIPDRPPSSLPLRRDDIVGNPTSPDLQRDYGVKPTQRRWREASYAIIQEIASKPKIDDWQELLQCLESKRHNLADELNQYCVEESISIDGNDFGLSRTIRSDVIHREDILPDRGAWKLAYPECRQLAIEYAQHFFRNFLLGNPVQDIVHIRFNIFDVMDDILDEGKINENIKSFLTKTFGKERVAPFFRSVEAIPEEDDERSDEEAKRLGIPVLEQMIVLLDHLKESKDILFPIYIEYPSGHFAEAVLKRDAWFASDSRCKETEDPIAYRDKIDATYAELLKPEKNLQEFREKAAKFYYLMIRLLPCHRGSASIIDWMARGIALKKGYALGQYNHQTLGWDLRALLTLPEALRNYCQWFSNQAFC